MRICQYCGHAQCPFAGEPFDPNARRLACASWEPQPMDYDYTPEGEIAREEN